MILMDLFLVFFMIGAFTVGGGYAMLPFIQSEVINRDWMAPEVITNFIAVSESTPGPFAINIATYIGSVKGGEWLDSPVGSVLGAFCATMGVVLPSFIIILIVARVFEKFKTNKYVKSCMTGLRPAVVGLIGAAVLSVAISVFWKGWDAEMAVSTKVYNLFQNPEMFSQVLTKLGTMLKSAATYISLGIFAVMTVLAFKKVHPIIIICISAAVGIVAGYTVGLPV